VDQDQHGNWWLATEDAGLVKLRDGKVLKIYTAQDGLPRPTVNPKVSWIYPSVALEDRKGNLWLNGAGPWLGRLKDGIFSAYPSADTSASHPLRLTPGPAGSQINKLLEDREGNLWIGTEGSGLIRAREQIVNVVSTKQGLHAANIYPVFEDRAGAVWLGTWDLGMARVSAGVVTNFPLGFPHGNVTAFCQDRASRLWVGTIGGVFIFEQDTVSMTGVPASFAHLPVSAICEDHDGVLWFGAERGLFQLQNGELTLRAPNEVPGVIKVIIAAQDGSLWIGSRSGLTRLTNGRFTTWTEKDGLPSDNVTALYEDEGALWIGTADGGLARFQGGRFTSYTTREGMFDNGVYQILEDADGNLWMSSNRGIYRVSKAELNEVAAGRRRSITSIAYGRSDGMLNPECNGGRSPAGVRTRDGRLWFPTQDGVAVIDPAALSPNPKPPPVVIESFLVDRAPQSLSTAVRVPPGKSNIEIQYTGLSLVNSERIRFKYRLGGAGDDWLEAGPRRTAYYSHLAPGHYTFTVLAANSDGVWNDIGASLAFAVLPAWHQTAWFRGVAVLAIVGLAVGFYRRRVSRLETQHAAQQNFSRRLIDSQEQERKRIAAELHDSLGQHLLVIKNRAALGLNSTAAGAPEQLTEISRAATQALEEVREISQNLRPYQLDRLGLTRALHGLVKKVGTSSALNCVADITPLDGLFPPEAQINLFRIVQEGLNNILKHSGATEARVIVERDAAGVRLLIADNGRGFDSQTASASPARAGGMGLNGIAERVRILRGRLDIEASPGGGTRLQIELPLPLAENKS
jgi:signal transduction histidine kinase/streptogramin lyase